MKKRKAREWWAVCNWDYSGCLIKHTKKEARSSAKFLATDYGKQRILKVREVLYKKKGER